MGRNIKIISMILIIGFIFEVCPYMWEKFGHYTLNYFEHVVIVCLLWIGYFLGEILERLK